MTLHCPKCKSVELRSASQSHPGMLNIRGFKVTDKRGNHWSHCLVCAGYYGPRNDAAVVPAPGYTESKGWFK